MADKVRTEQERDALDAQIKQLQAEIAAVKQAKLYADCLEARFGRRPMIIVRPKRHHVKRFQDAEQWRQLDTDAHEALAEDEIGEAEGVHLEQAAYGVDRGRFLMKVRGFLVRHVDHLGIRKLRHNQQLTATDLDAQGAAEVFSHDDARELVAVMWDLRARAAAWWNPAGQR